MIWTWVGFLAHTWLILVHIQMQFVFAFCSPISYLKAGSRKHA